jgi:hypothetical protein
MAAENGEVTTERTWRRSPAGLTLLLFAPFLVALALSLVLYSNRQEILLRLCQVLVVWLPLVALRGAGLLLGRPRFALALAAGAAAAALALHFARPILMPRLTASFYNLPIDHRPAALAGHRNADGVAPDAPARQYRAGGDNVIFLGDGYTQGVWLRDDRSAFPFVVEKLLGEREPRRAWRVANFAWEAASPALELRQLRQIGANYHPRLVVQIFEMPDFYHDVVAVKKLQDAGLLHPERLSLPGAAEALLSRALGVDDFLGFLRDNFAWKIAAGEIPSGRAVPTTTPRNSDIGNEYFFMWMPLSQAEPFFAATWEAIRDAQAVAASLGAKYALFILPCYQQYNRRESPKDPRKMLVPESDEHLWEVFDYFARQAATVAFPIHSLLPDFRDGGEYPTTLEDDYYLNEAGHALAARAIVRDLEKDGLLDGR